jgi:hypothetical protein
MMERAKREGTDRPTAWSAYETKAASIAQERRSEELQLERLKLRLQGKIQEAAVRARTLTAA